jgi:GT2 family glycosyltransferase
VSKLIHIVVPVHNRRAISVRLAEQLSVQSRKDFEVLLIDDGSVDGTTTSFVEILPNTISIRGPGTWWWAGCLQAGYQWLEKCGTAPEELVCLMNDDVEIATDFVERAVQEVANHPNTFVLARQRDASTGVEIDQGGGIRADLNRLRFVSSCSPEEINCLPTRGLWMRWADLQKTGGFRPRLLPHYLSDYEFTIRAKRRGLELKVADTFFLGVKLNQSGWSADDLLAFPRQQRIRTLLSNRFKQNPLAWSAFVWLTAPIAQRPWLLCKVWGHFGILLLRCVLHPVRHKT